MRRLLPALTLMIMGLPCCLACLRDTIDARGIQWSTLIVDARLISVGDQTPLASPFSYRVYQFQITQTFDGKAQGKQISVIKFFSPQGNGSPVCGMLTPDAVGQSFVLLLRPEADVPMGGAKDDPRTPKVHALHAFTIVYMAAQSDLGSSGIDDLKGQISDTRQAEAAVTNDAATLQAQTLAGAADDTEADQAEQALEEMGFKALPAIKKVYDSADASGKDRLKPAIDALSLPSMPVEQDTSASP
ncbi:MAG TPA: hypothetical protein VMD30_03800 [Tepidisphaeraceae bacterium]|nr:hypothetical protein [Tepidisphaeraceae bacterium]